MEVGILLIGSIARLCEKSKSEPSLQWVRLGLPITLTTNLRSHPLPLFPIRQSSVRWRPPYQNAAPGECCHPASKTQHIRPVPPGEAFGIYPPGSEVSADYPTSGNESMTYGIGVIARLHALDLSRSDGSRIQGPRRCGCDKPDSIYRMPQIPNC